LARTSKAGIANSADALSLSAAGCPLAQPELLGWASRRQKNYEKCFSHVNSLTGQSQIPDDNRP
jgi:hypothetical protein